MFLKDLILTLISQATSEINPITGKIKNVGKTNQTNIRAGLQR
jgi:hypothetical protein